MMNQNLDYKFFYWGPFVTKFILDKEFCDKLLEKGRSLKEDARKGLAGHLEKELSYSKEDKQWFVDNMSSVLSTHMNDLVNYHNKKHFIFNDRLPNLQVKTLWVNFMKAGEYNPPHIHSDKLSFVIYLQVPKILEEENKNYIGADSMGPGGIKFINDTCNDMLKISEIPIFPRERECYIFPASLLHTVSPFKSDCERISVSGNVDFV